MTSASSLAVPVPIALKQFVRQRAQLPFEWGTRDCLLLAADAVQAGLGVDPAADLRGRYANAVQAARLWRRLGGWLPIIQQRFGKPLPMGAAPDGAAVLVNAGACTDGLFDGQSMGFLWRGLVVAQGAAGLVFVPRRACAGAWGPPV